MIYPNRRSVVWLMGVRRVGKTVLARSLPRFEYVDCELPRVRRLLDDPESFLLQDSAGILKIAADHCPLNDFATQTVAHRAVQPADGP